MKSANELKPNYAAVYAAALYPDLCPIFHRHGYALAVHGSLARDFDLIAVPWAESVSPPDVVLAGITGAFAVRLIGGLKMMRHGRLCQTISIGHGNCSIDLSFLPYSEQSE